MATMIKPLTRGTMVGIPNCVGAYPIIRRTAPNYYQVLFQDFKTVIVKRERLVENLRSGQYLFCGQDENFIKVENGTVA